MKHTLALLAAFILVACGGSDVTDPPQPNDAGVYTWTSWNGHAIPYAHPDGHTYTGTLELKSGGSYDLNYTSANAEQMIIGTEHGGWVVRADSLSFNNAYGETWSCVRGQTLHCTWGGTSEWTRQQ